VSAVVTSGTERPPATRCEAERRLVRPAHARTRRLLLILALTVLLATMVLLSLAVGAKPIPLGSVWAALWNPNGTENDVIVASLRVPRTLLGVAVGLAPAWPAP
jgi:iron complex transport system permease protein